MSRMSVRLLVGAARSGKTRAAWRFALEKVELFERVIVLTLPSQRGFWLEGLAGLGASLGVEVTNLQNLSYRMLDRLGSNKAVVLNPGRVALTARALEMVLGRAALVGEARLYAQAIAECKRALFVPQVFTDEYGNVLARVFVAYQGLLESEDLQDLDDVRLRAAELLLRQPLPLGAHFVVDGYRSLNASEFAAIRALATCADSTLLTLPSGAPDTAKESWAHLVRVPDLLEIQKALGAKLERLPSLGKPWAGLPRVVRVRASANPVSEARAALRQVKAWLLEGVSARSVALVVPNHVSARVLEALAREYQVPLAPESLGGLLESSLGRVLEAALLVAARDFAAPELRVLAAVFPDLERLADALDKRGLQGGSSAYRVLLETDDLLFAWAVLDDLRILCTPPEFADPTVLVQWFEILLERIVPLAAWLPSARVMAREAARLLVASGQDSSGLQFAEWVRTLLSAAALPHPDAARGVAVLTPAEVSGRRFAKVLVLGVTEGAYQNLESEDFFIPEDDRVALEQVLQGTAAALPLRMNGLADAALYDVVTRADEELIISFPRAERGSSLAPHPRLARLGVPIEPELRITAGLLELAHTQNLGSSPVQSAVFKVEPRTAPFAATELEAVARCGLRAWATRLMPRESTNSLLPSLTLKNLRRSVSEETLLQRAPQSLQANLERFDPNFMALLESFEPAGNPLEMQVFKRTSQGIEFVLDGMIRRNDSNGNAKLLEVYRKLEDIESAFEAFRDSERHREWWFADIAMQSGLRVAFCAIDNEGRTKNVMNPGAEKSQKRLLESRAVLERSRNDLERGVVRATTGFYCRSCTYQDLCREVT